MTIDPADFDFVVSVLEKARTYNDRPNAYGTLRLIIDIRMGIRDALRFGAIVGAEPRPSSRRWRIRVRGTDAEELLAAVLPHLSTAQRARVEVSLARVHAEEPAK